MKQEAEQKRRQLKVFSARQKSQAVLSLWSGRRNTSALTEELGVAWGVLNSWEKAAIQGMLSALDPAWKQPEEGKMRLPMRVEKLFEQTLQPEVAVNNPRED